MAPYTAGTVLDSNYHNHKAQQALDGNPLGEEIERILNKKSSLSAANREYLISYFKNKFVEVTMQDVEEEVPENIVKSYMDKEPNGGVEAIVILWLGFKDIHKFNPLQNVHYTEEEGKITVYYSLYKTII